KPEPAARRTGRGKAVSAPASSGFTLSPGLHAHQRYGGAAGLAQHIMDRDRYIFSAEHPFLCDELLLRFGRIIRVLKVGAGEAGLDEAYLDILLGKFFPKSRNEALYTRF